MEKTTPTSIYTMQRLHQIAITLACIVVALGAYTRLKHAGLGCPDWPKCYQNWIVHPQITIPALSSNATQKAWIEMIHRYAAGILSIIIAMLKLTNHSAKKIPCLLNKILGIILIQALFGMWTVTWRLHPLAVMPHLIGGMTITTLLYIDYIKKYQKSNTIIIPHPIKSCLQYLWIAVFLQIIIGGWTSANYAALICPDLPLCQGKWLTSVDHFMQGFTLPIGHHNYEGGVISGEGRMAIHITHRIGALICSGIILRLSWRIHDHKKQLSRAFIAQYITLFLCFMIQITFGILNVIWQLPISIAVGHNIIALSIIIQISRMLTYRYTPVVKQHDHPPFLQPTAT